MCGRVIIACGCPGDARELLLQVCAVVGHRVALFNREVPTPVRNLDQPLHAVHLDDGGCVLESQGDLFADNLGSRSGVRAECKATARLSRVLSAVGLRVELSEIRDFVVGEFQLGFLFLGGVCGVRILVHSPLKELFLDLGNEGRDGGEDVGDSEGDLQSEGEAGGEGGVEEDTVVLCVAVYQANY